MSPAHDSRLIRRAFVALVAVVAITACMSAAPTASNAPAPTPERSTFPVETPPPPDSSPPAAVPDTAWHRALSAVDEDGRYSLDAALTLFATAFGPLPGVDVEQDLTGVGDRTIAISSLMSHRSSLTSEQLAAVDEYLAMPADADVITIPPIAEARQRAALAVSGSGFAAMDDAARTALTDAALDIRREIAGHLGRDFAGDLSIGFIPTAGPPTPYGGTALADAWSDWSGGVFGDCSIRIYKEVQAGEPVEWLNTVAHELTHCFQFDGYRTIEAETAAPAWVKEGQAEWSAATITSGADVVYDGAAWASYLAVTLPLTMRNVDAIGFYAHLAETGTDPWSVFQDMWNAGSNNIEIFKQANANTDVFLDSWASSLMRQPDRGRAWDTTGPGIEGTDASLAPNWSSVSDGTTVDLSTAFFYNNVRMLQLSSDLLHVSIEGNGRLSDWAMDTTNLSDVWFCVEGHDCEPKCPEDVAAMPPISGTVRETVAIATSGGIEGTLGRAIGMDLKSPDECETPEPSPTEDEFCKRYRAWLAWSQQNAGTEYELSQPWAAEIARQFREMRPYAPPQLVEHVDLYVSVYGTYATAPEPINVPIVGPQAAGISTAFFAMNAYCGVALPGAPD